MQPCNTRGKCKSRGRGGGGGGESTLLCSLELFLAWGRGGPRAFSKEPISCPSFQDFGEVSIPGLEGPASVVQPHPWCPGSPAPEGEGEGLIWRSNAVVPGGANLQLPGDPAPQCARLSVRDFLRSPFLSAIRSLFTGTVLPFQKCLLNEVTQALPCRPDFPRRRV